MPRNSGGVYSLPAGNPVVTGEVISSAWANTTLTDIATAMTASLSRSGEGSMLAQLGLFAGTIGTPGLAFSLETTSGLYRAAAGDFRWAIGGVDVWSFTSAGVTFPTYLSSGAIPKFVWNETDAAANNRRWDALVNNEQMEFRTVNDADNAAVTWLAVNRTLNVVDSLAFTATVMTIAGNLLPSGSRTIGSTAGSWTSVFASLLSDGTNLELVSSSGTTVIIGQGTSWTAMSLRTGGTSRLSLGATSDFVNTTLNYGGFEVGYRQLNDRTFSGSDNTTAADAGKMVSYTGTGGHTFTADTDPALSAVITVRNAGSAALTLAGSASLQWYNGSGAITFGNRTLAVGGIATMYQGSAGNYLVWGTGLS